MELFIPIIAIAVVIIAVIVNAHQRKRSRQAAELIAQLLETDRKRDSAMELAVAQIDEHEKRISAAESKCDSALDRHATFTGERFESCEDRIGAMEGDAKRLNALCVDIENRRAQDRETAKNELTSTKRRMDEMDDARRRLDERLSRDEHRVDAAFSEEREATEKALSEVRDSVDKAMRMYDEMVTDAAAERERVNGARAQTRALVEAKLAAHDEGIARRLDGCATKAALEGIGKRVAKVESSENRFEHAAKKAAELDEWRTDAAKAQIRLTGDMARTLKILDSQSGRIGALESAQPQAQIVADLVQGVAELRACPAQSRAAVQDQQVKDIARALEELQSKFIEGLGDGDDSVPAIMQRRGAEIEALLDIAQHNADTQGMLQRRIIALESADPREARNREIAEAYHTGLGSYTEIGRMFGVSRRTAMRYAKRYPKTEPQGE